MRAEVRMKTAMSAVAMVVTMRADITNPPFNLRIALRHPPARH
jgi:hypothetical protein